MSYIYIGSHALNQYRETPKPVNDYDLIADIDTAQNLLKKFDCQTIYPINEGKYLFGKTREGVIYEVELAWSGTTAEELLDIVTKHWNKNYAPLGVLYALKMSHRYKKNSPHFLKTMRDIYEMRLMGACTIHSSLTEWYKRREDETYDYSHPNLNQGKGDFFSGDGVQYVYDHDTLHDAVAGRIGPIYKMYQKDGSEVLCDKKKWEALPKYMKVAAVYEEACVLALERSLIPHPGVLTPLQAFDMALMKVCTSITSGWFREFAWEHYFQVRDMFVGQTYSLMDRFQDGLEKGVIKPHVANENTD